MMKNKKVTSIKIDQELWNKFKIYSIRKKIEISKILEKLIKKELKIKSIRGNGVRNEKE